MEVVSFAADVCQTAGWSKLTRYGRIEVDQMMVAKGVRAMMYPA